MHPPWTGFGVEGSGFVLSVYCVGFEKWDVGCGLLVRGLGCGVFGLDFGGWGLGCVVWGFGVSEAQWLQHRHQCPQGAPSLESVWGLYFFFTV
jgi:hypothetical protein